MLDRKNKKIYKSVYKIYGYLITEYPETTRTRKGLDIARARKRE